ncbi:putative GNAT family N-acetyltransferase [Aspergillus pseudonomiae]|uniref:Putative GNAT family N-acetyltransferase n=1 Tax=Aspergillus pseudonomiae TaxID=1506151 RepID=A0A5N7D4D7_9EURO|nr:putative GNAT family N-acetyltransferase [Aspergillus pseudonomiae]KAB8264782.1 putative GNAT family N-acetyltransferase [Aspergillus pseudonomiae]KAE8400997.1 putative GNAT family N-acetyltransferase [Aspergillus pseudonomiae]
MVAHFLSMVSETILANIVYLLLSHLDPPSVSAVAQTITLSFVGDPLIRWLRPSAAPWSTQEHETNKWQYRRVQQAILEGIVLRSTSAPQLAQEFPACSQQKGLPASLGEINSGHDGPDAGTVALLFPPKNQQTWKWNKIALAVKLWFLSWLDPVSDNGADEKRVDILLDAHDTALKRITTRYNIPDPWYLEVVAVHPTLQGRGLGKIMMERVLDYVGHTPIVLECTAEQNLGFYTTLGFEVVEKVELADNGGAVSCWFMLRRANAISQ